MSISKRNAEGYRDMTAYKAINAVSRDEKRKRRIKAQPPMVYICSPFAGNTEDNVTSALEYCRFALSKGMFPIAPHCYLPRFMDDNNPAERELAMSFALRFLENCEELWIFGSCISNGMKREIEAVKWSGTIIRRFDENMEEVRYERFS